MGPHGSARGEIEAASGLKKTDDGVTSSRHQQLVFPFLYSRNFRKANKNVLGFCKYKNHSKNSCELHKNLKTILNTFYSK